PVLTRALERIDELVELALPADERSAHRDGLASDPRARLERLPRVHGLALSLGFDRRQLAELDRLARRAIRDLADEHAVDRRSRLQPRSRVHDIARSHALPRLGTRSEVDQRLPRVDGDPHLHPAVLARPVANRERSPHRALRI